jgi:hypothetical protein
MGFLREHHMELAPLGIWPPETLKRLSRSWITTAEQVVAVAATDDGMLALAEQTGLSVRDLAPLVDRTRQALPPGLREQLSKPADTSQFGTGAKPTRTEK